MLFWVTRFINQVIKSNAIKVTCESFSWIQSTWWENSDKTLSVFVRPSNPSAFSIKQYHWNLNFQNFASGDLFGDYIFWTDIYWLLINGGGSDETISQDAYPHNHFTICFTPPLSHCKNVEWFYSSLNNGYRIMYYFVSGLLPSISHNVNSRMRTSAAVTHQCACAVCNLHITS